MTQTMRWFGPRDPVRLRDIRQAGATEVVTAMHEVPNGAMWTREAIAARKAEIRAAGLDWTVVESLPVDEGLKTQSGEWGRLIDNYRQSLRNLAVNGIRVVTYNFMPLLDWTRTDLAWELPDGARALRYEAVAVAAYDIHILRRPGAEQDYDAAMLAAAESRHAAMGDAARAHLERTIIAGLPGSEEGFTSAAFRDAIDTYADIDAARLRDHHVAFLEAVCPVADELGIRLVVHPDDPPFPIFGLPRVVSTEADVVDLFTRVPARSNGLCMCTGSFGVRADNDLPSIARRFASRIHFSHLRATKREADPRSFHESAHLEGDVDMVAVLRELVAEDKRRGKAETIVFRSDHGHRMLDDLRKDVTPGYPATGRMRGLAELRGILHALGHPPERPAA